MEAAILPSVGLGVGPFATGRSHRQIPTPVIMAAMRSERDGGSNRLFLLGTGSSGDTCPMASQDKAGGKNIEGKGSFLNELAAVREGLLLCKE
ncbi:hypothetical protein MUK42_36614 [Musa troglodytarum]|uniref:Uncharacterized protein n=1 Tax=Musa troglodytarum TaxID=320322 RepID=A0A9E7J9G4_9LILI|nr:hypothetical protein MUK42_36614 [Musa troglodytarum]